MFQFELSCRVWEKRGRGPQPTNQPTNQSSSPPGFKLNYKEIVFADINLIFSIDKRASNYVFQVIESELDFTVKKLNTHNIGLERWFRG